MADIDEGLLPFVNGLTKAWSTFPNLETLSFVKQREAAEKVRAPWTKGGPTMANTEDFSIPGPKRDIRIRLHTPAGHPERLPGLIYLHGGGFTTFSIDTHDRIMREYAARAGIKVIGIDYTLAPEAKFPDPLFEVGAVQAWMSTNAGQLGFDPKRIAIGGDSAGANLALAASLIARDRGKAQFAALLFAYGFFDDDEDTSSHRLYGGDHELLSSAALRQFLDNYVSGTGREDDPLALPARAELHDLPPSFHIVAECDPLADQDLAIADKMRRAGNQVRCTLYRGATHSFLEAVSIAPIAVRALEESAQWLRAQLTR